MGGSMAEQQDVTAMTDVDAVWRVMQAARTAGDDQTAEVARRRLGELTPSNERAVRSRHADAPMPARWRVALAVGVGLVLGLVIGGGLLVVGYGNIAWPGAAVGFVIGLVVATLAAAPNRVHHPDAGAESIMNYVRGEGGS